METQQMAMPAEMAAQGPNPEEMAIYDQMRQQISPQEFSNEMLAGASQVDPQAVAEFTEELQSLDVSPEELDALNDLVDQILASPEQYDQLRQQFLAQGMPDDILPEQFDPYFFAALNMAVDQLIAAPAGVQAFAEGGIAELKPIAKAIASYGRNGDTMLAHITPAEARMLKRRGGSGTINPATGLPEFFLKKAFKSIGKAVKKFASSTVGRLVATVALGFFLGPAAASMVGATSAAGVAAVSGFVGGAGSTLLAGGNLRDALKAGAIGGLVAGAGTGLMGGADSFASGSASTAGLTPGQALQSRVDQFTGMFKPGAAVQASVPQEGATPSSLGPNQAPTPDAGQGLDISSKKVSLNADGTRVYPSGPPNGALPPADAGSAAYDLNMQAQQAARTGSTFDPRNALTDNVTTGAQRDAYMAGQGLDKGTSLVDQTKQFYKENISPSGIREAATPGAQRAGEKAVSDLLARVPTATPAMQETAFQTAFKTAMPGVMGTYAPMAGVGLGIMGLTGGFQSKSGPGITAEDRRGPTERIREEGSQKKYFVQGMPGVKYDQFGEPMYGESNPFTTQDPTFALPATIGGIQGVAPPMAMYSTPPGSFGSRQVAQPYNTASMYTNLMGPQRYAYGGQVQYFEDGGDVAPPPPAAAGKTPEQIAADEAARVERVAQGERDRAARAAQKTAADQAKQMRRAAGSGNMYANINAGIAALAPETNPMDAADTGFGARNRTTQLAALNQTYAPMLQGQRNAMTEQARILGFPNMAPGQIGAMPMGSAFPSPAAPGPTAMPPVAAQPTVRPSVVQQPPAAVQQAPVAAPAFSSQNIQDYLSTRPNMTDAQIRTQMDQFGVTPAQMAAATGLPVAQVQQRYDAPSNFSNEAIQSYLAARPGLTDMQIRSAMDEFKVTPAQMAAATGVPMDQVQQRYAAAAARPMNMGGIAALAQGGYPRRTGQISGPGTEKSDSIPAMLSDGEFVMTAKAVRGAGKGNRRAGAKQMYKLMHQLEKNSERG
jgi:hypothetical protein